MVRTPRIALRRAALLALGLALAACARGEPNLMRIDRGGNSPDEFAILPGKPVEIPENLAALPPPAPPGSGSRTDPTPEQDAVAALGGNPARMRRDGQAPASDLMASAGRFGTDGNIRADLAVEDAEFRRRNRGRLLERWVGLTTYFDAYQRSDLNQHAEQERVRGAGVRSSGAPPRPPE